MAWDETFDVGLDTGTSVDDRDYQAAFAFTGTLGKITIDLGESSVSPEAIKLMMEELAKKRDRHARREGGGEDEGHLFHGESPHGLDRTGRRRPMAGRALRRRPRMIAGRRALSRILRRAGGGGHEDPPQFR